MSSPPCWPLQGAEPTQQELGYTVGVRPPFPLEPPPAGLANITAQGCLTTVQLVVSRHKVVVSLDWTTLAFSAVACMKPVWH
jgi:hypothetical protein